MKMIYLIRFKLAYAIAERRRKQHWKRYFSRGGKW